MMFLAAFDALKAANAEPALNVKVLLDSEEEKGSVNIGDVAKAHHELLRSDGLVINDGPRHGSEKPTIVFGNRGNTTVRLTVYGARSNLPSALSAFRSIPFFSSSFSRDTLGLESRIAEVNSLIEVESWLVLVCVVSRF